MGREVELKFAWPPRSGADAIVTALPAGTRVGPARVRTMHSRYHEDPRLQTAGLTLRSRCEGGDWVGTVKGPTVAGSRLEVEVPLPGPPAPGDPLPDELARVIADAAPGLSTWPETAYEALFERRAYDLSGPPGPAELAFDRGEVRAGGRSAPLRELELEAGRGGAASLLPRLDAVQARIPLRPAGLSKAGRARALLRAPEALRPRSGPDAELLELLEGLDLAGMPSPSPALLDAVHERAKRLARVASREGERAALAALADARGPHELGRAASDAAVARGLWSALRRLLAGGASGDQPE